MNKNNTNNQLDIARVRWACRRGMLELDFMLMKFVDGVYEDLSEDDKIRFMNLLKCEDPELFSWLMGQELPEDPDLCLILGKIHDYIRKPV